MDWLFNNSLANLPGPQFLTLYAIAIATTTIALYYVKKQLDEPGKRTVPGIPAEPDPYEIAFLRGGANELLRLLIFRLVQRRLLELRERDNETWIYPTNVRVEQRGLKPLEAKTLEWFAGGSRSAREVFDGGELAYRLAPFVATYENHLTERGLITSAATRGRIASWMVMAFLVVVGIGGYKFINAMMYGRSNVGFLIIFGIVGCVAVLTVARTPRLTEIGKSYLKQLQFAFERLKFDARGDAPARPVAETPAATAAVDPALLMVGVFGMGALTGTEYSQFNQAFKRGQQDGSSFGSSDSGGSCGSNCSSGSSSGGDGGSSCGGGCGGCGGGCS